MRFQTRWKMDARKWMKTVGRYLLDTNIVIALFSGDPKVLKKLRSAREVFIPSIAVGELCYGAWKSSKPRHNLHIIHEFSAANTVLSVDADTAEAYGQLKAALKAKGRIMPENDLWIAALARHYGLTLVSRDKHFYDVEGFSLVVW